jgi:tRNA G18 (ribose-2'-O)-methylase SpoU
VRVESVESLDDPRVADYRNLRDPALRDERGLFIAEGRLTVKRLFASPRFRARSVFATESGLRGLEHDRVTIDDETPVFVATQGLLSEVVGYRMHRGCLATGERGVAGGPGAPLADVVRDARRILVLEDLADPDNIGGIFRNALAFGVDAVVLTQRCADPLYRKSIRVSMGAVLTLPFTRIPDASESLTLLKEQGFEVVATTTAAARELDSFAPIPERVALLFGTEGEGLSAAALDAADHHVRIPMARGADSLNVATASGIVLHHFARSRPDRFAGEDAS